MKVCRAYCAIKRASRASRRCRLTRSSPSSRRRRPKSLPMRRIGAPARWPKPSGSAIAFFPGLKPHRAETFKLSNDSRSSKKSCVDVVGLYLSPACQRRGPLGRREEPDPSLRSHPAEPPAQERPSRHDDARLQAPRHHDSLRRTQRADRRACQHCSPPSPRRVPHLPPPHQPRRRAQARSHLIVDNYDTHNTPMCSPGSSAPRIHLHFTPTTSSWLNLVERSTSGPVNGHCL